VDNIINFSDINEKMKKFNFFRFTRNWILVLFIGWLIVSPVPDKISADSPIFVTGGQQERTSKIVQIPAPKAASSTKAPQPKVSESLVPEASAQRIRFRASSGDPSGSGNDDFDDNIGTKKWEDWACPEPEQIISNPEFWSNVADDPDICTDEDDCEDEDEEIEIERFPRRRLLGVSPTPTGKLDEENLKNFDFTNKKLQPMVFPSREGIRLSMDARSIRKVVYSHSMELGLSDLGSRISCPVQPDPTKSQRQKCWAITDMNMREAVIKIFEYTTFNNPRIVTLEMTPTTCSNQRATYFLDLVTGNSVYFRIGGKQDGKLWSLDHFDRAEILDIMTNPDVKVLTDLSDYNFNF
jgi:hypothetical protein